MLSIKLKKNSVVRKAYHEWLMNLAKLPFLVASIDSCALREMINASFRPEKHRFV